ncbi:sensor histidine kinase [Nocardioides sediminis]|uniref:sensor histidine kinase n=1 Tax=Nocardioides sediminis TaxID=433648 RepID=UPI000D321306|nr:HAMP domain-containing sensor histidine kinase [Nocardioides sediminis]
MTDSPALQHVASSAHVSPGASKLAARILDTGMRLNDAFSEVADHLLGLMRAEVVTISLTTFAPEDEDGWVHLGQRAWVTEWLKPGTACSVLPPPGAGPEAALSMPWVSPRAREEALVVTDIDLLPDEAAQDQRELSANGFHSLIVHAHVSDGVMYGSLAVGSPHTGDWPVEYVADFRLLHAALTSRMAQEQARRSLADAVAAGAKTREAQQHFFGSIGHELRTPLTAIVGYTEMLVDEAEQQGDDPFADAVQRDGAVILRACEQLMAVVEDLLSAGRTMGTEESRESVDVAGAVEDVVHWHRATARSAGVDLDCEVSPGQTVWAHAAGFRQILSNLVGNAVVHNPGGSVHVSTQALRGETGEPRLRVIVRDTGEGLDADRLRTAFDPFVRHARPDVKGTGLGLSLSRSLAERDGGTVDAESTPGKGSAFWVELPATEDARPV